MPQHFHVAPNRQLLHRKQRIHAGRLHARSADAGEMHGRQALAQRLYEMSSQQVTGRLARNHADGKRRLGHERALAHDAARGAGKEIEQEPDFRAPLHLLRELETGLLQRKARAIQRTVGALEPGNAVC